ncbi:hypothetical protein GE061_017636 [Apolygus lucorum]|uniref:ABC transporter domain-containing protein n=1 Tax=Apolygus lucorum TaxID=248454 RepID=A0A8S9XBQ6_APOLU|nr:hypothetical protein GE061_017636 [Apolygus lucorum]
MLAIFVAVSCEEDWPHDPPKELRCTPGYEHFWNKCNHCWCVKRSPDERKDVATEYASYCHDKAHWFSRVTFFWLTPLLKMGYSQPLELEDLGRLPLKETAFEQSEHFLQAYLNSKGTRGDASLWRCYFHCYWKKFALGGLLKLAGDLVGLIAPLGMSVVIDYVSQDNNIAQPQDKDRFVTLDQFFRNGYVMAVIIFVSAMLQGSFSQASTHVINVEGIRLKTALQGLIYEKVLKLGVSNSDTSSYTASDSKIGNICNLMSEDTFNIMTCIWIAHYIWAIPLKIFLLLYLLYYKLGVSAVIGASCCILVVTPLQFYIGKKMSNNSKVISDFGDERLRMTNEMLQGIRVLKLCGWESQFSVRINDARNKELKLLDRDSLYWALMTFLTHTSTPVISIVTFGAYFYLVGTRMSVPDVFSAVALFNQLTVPLFILPITVPLIISAVVSTNRMREFLNLPETSSYSIPEQLSNASTPEAGTPPNGQGTENDERGLKDIIEEEDDLKEIDYIRDWRGKSVGANICVMRKAKFSWRLQEPKDKPFLSIDYLDIPRGQLTAVIGRVGSGKSSLLSALLGEMKCTGGLIKWEKGATFAYVSQQPWILNASLRENVLMGLSYKAKRFSRVIAATALQPDIDILPNKDLTEIGERGVNLSGGQRQRIAIARALYSRANVLLLDDPLAALDYNVAQHVFDEGIINLAVQQKKTAIMVTHSLHLLTHAHKVVALEGGKVRAAGKLRDMELVDGVVTGIEALDTRGKTARERWQLVKLVSKIGHHIRQQNIKFQNQQIFIPFRRKLSTGSEYYWAHDLPLPSSLDGERDLPLRRSTTLPRYRPVTRASSLQPQSSAFIASVQRQASTQSINHSPRHRTYMFDGAPEGGGNLLKHIFMSSNKNLKIGVEPCPQAGWKEKSILKRLMSTTSLKSMIYNDNEKQPGIQRLPSTYSDYSDDQYDEEDDLDPDWCGAQSSDDRQYGTIASSIYLSYLESCGVFASFSFLTLAVGWQGFRVYTDFWLSSWTQLSSTIDQDEAFYYLLVYTGFSLAGVFISLVTNLLGQLAGARARRRLHKNLLDSVLQLPIKIFEMTPLGRILARFSTDINVIDKKLCTSIQRLTQFLLLCCSAIVVNSIVTPWFITIAVPICTLYYFVQKFYRCSSRELQRLDSISRTPILSHLAESITGLETIRAFKQQRRFKTAMYHKLDCHTNAFLIANSATRWLGIALDYLGAVIVLLAMIVCLVCSWLMPEVVTPSLVGLAINYTLLVPIYLNWVVKFLSDVETHMAGVERVAGYIEMQPEDYKTNGFIPRSWPSKGEIRFDNVSLRYDRSSEVAVTGLKLTITPGSKVGICGKTGSGKSSIVMSLFGMTPVIIGSIYIDGIDISAVPLQILRSRLSVIPQDIIMFSGTIRENLDLENTYTDDQIWESLELAQMKETVSTKLGGLYGRVLEGGVNISVGQRQLLCLARAILHQAAILVMDEATSSLDPTTEKTMLNAAEKAFANKTVISIAHRLSTLLSCDRILVLEGGKVVEDGSPSDLLSRSMGIFSSMLRAAEVHAVSQIREVVGLVLSDVNITSLLANLCGIVIFLSNCF